MKLSISKKFAKRSIKCLALFAPLAYLFGSLFFGLNGAHGTQLWAETESTNFTLKPSYNIGYIARADNGFLFATNNAVASDSVHLPISGEYSYNVVSSSAITLTTLRFSFYREDGSYIQYTDVYSPSFPVSFYPVEGSYFFRISLYGIDYAPDVYFLLDGPESIDLQDKVSFNEYTFGQFFAKDNFLVQWGENAISENPVGFAPFGAFFKLLDDNIFHLSDSQIGLMAYGYLYYCLHVLIACLAFDIVAFIPLFVQRVQDKLGGKEDD